MVEVLKMKYWSRSDNFILPLTGLSKLPNQHSYLFWNDYSINDYQLIITYDYKDYNKFLAYALKNIFPILDKNGYLVENYDVKEKSIFVLDISEWALDINLFLLGKYSKFSKEAKEKIEYFHTEKRIIPVQIYSILYPEKELKILDNMTGIEYVSRNYGVDLPLLKELGELGSIYDKESETLNISDNMTEN